MITKIDRQIQRSIFHFYIKMKISGTSGLEFHKYYPDHNPEQH